jgi:hypothetical protein
VEWSSPAQGGDGMETLAAMFSTKFSVAISRLYHQCEPFPQKPYVAHRRFAFHALRSFKKFKHVVSP